MQKFVVKCGVFAVLVDLHILPQGAQNSNTWFSQEHKEEVGALIQDALEQRVRQFLEARQLQSKQKKELSADSPLCIKGQTLRLAAYFMKRHVNLRCITKQHGRGLRIFPERFVVCVTLLENGMAPCGNLKQDMMMQSGQSRSEYFTCPKETQELINNSTTTKKAILQKITRQVSANPRPESEHEFQNHGATPSNSTGAVEVSLQVEELAQDDVRDVCVPRPSEGDVVQNNDNSAEKMKQNCNTENTSEHHARDHASDNIRQDLEKTDRRRRRSPSSPREDTDRQEAKRACLQEFLIGAEIQRHSTMALSQSSTLGTSPSLPGAAAQAASEGTLEEELLTHGKQAQRLPYSNSTAKHTNRSRLAANLRGLSVKAVSSDSSISSRSAARDEEKPSVPRISRLRRLKKS
ncbi:protein SLX4IP [Hoplias malabaricus]|uniref:protein SLX4IP n=1 Tax=Hoplias malabaricus TaxID=27720 RepID=UPI003462E02D